MQQPSLWLRGHAITYNYSYAPKRVIYFIACLLFEASKQDVIVLLLLWWERPLKAKGAAAGRAHRPLSAVRHQQAILLRV